MNANFKAAIIGCGAIAGGYDGPHGGKKEAWTHAKAYQLNKSTNLVAACDTDPSTLASFCRKWRVPGAFTEIDSMMKTIRPDIVSVCVPDNDHYGVIRRLTSYPLKAIICEKPLAMSSSAAEATIRACRKSNIALFVNYFRYWDPVLTRLGEQIKHGCFGKVQLCRVVYTKGLMHNGSHFIHLLLHWFGNPRRIRVFEAKRVKSNDVRADFMMTMRDCPKVYFSSLDEQWYETFDIDLWMEKGKIELLRGGREIRITPVANHPVLTRSKILSANVPDRSGTLGVAMIRMLDHVVMYLKGGKPAPDVAPVIQTLEICETVRNYVQ